MSRFRTTAPRRKVLSIERVPIYAYNLRFTLECGHTQIRSRHQECATLACLDCEHEQEQRERLANDRRQSQGRGGLAR
jgi:hypothetical protein